MKAIDEFCHILPPEYYEAAVKETTAQYHMFTRALNMKAMSDVSERRKILEQFPGYQQLPCLVSPAVEYFADKDKSPAIAALGNDCLKKIADSDNDLYPGFIAGIPANNVSASIDELKRVKEMGAKGIQIFTHINGAPTDSEEFWLVYETCEKLDLPIVLHPVGGMIPMLAGRLENGLKLYGSRTGEALKEKLTKTKLKGDPVNSFKKFYADSASFGSAAAIACGLDFFGTNHILFATDMPFDPEQGPGFLFVSKQFIDNYITSA